MKPCYLRFHFFTNYFNEDTYFHTIKTYKLILINYVMREFGLNCFEETIYQKRSSILNEESREIRVIHYHKNL